MSRLEALSDAIFGFSATLLVVSLEVPRTFGELLANLYGFAAFALSFTALVGIWVVHNAFFRRYPLEDATTIVLNSVLLFVVIYFVYPLKFLTVVFAQNVLGIGTGVAGIPSVQVATLQELGSLFVLYSLGFAAVFLCYALLYRHAHGRAEELGLSVAERHDAGTSFRHYLIFVVVGLLSAGLAWSGVGVRYAVPGWMYMLLGPFCYAHGVWSTRMRAELAEA